MIIFCVFSLKYQNEYILKIYYNFVFVSKHIFLIYKYHFNNILKPSSPILVPPRPFPAQFPALPRLPHPGPDLLPDDGLLVLEGGVLLEPVPPLTSQRTKPFLNLPLQHFHDALTHLFTLPLFFPPLEELAPLTLQPLLLALLGPGDPGVDVGAALRRAQSP